MNLRDILVFLDESDASEGRLQLATNIAHDHGACLSAVFLQNGYPGGPRPRISGRWFGRAAGQAIRGTVVTPPVSEITVEQRYRNRLRSLEVEGDWHSLDQIDSDELIPLAQAVDLVVIGQVEPGVRTAFRPEEIVASCGRPTLMVPYIGHYRQVGRRVLVAWDGSREAVRALNDALPLIRTAAEVSVMTVRVRPGDLESGCASMKPIIRHLARHGIAARGVQALQMGAAVSDELLSRSVDLAADLLVAGAYHHSQLRESLLGGVSRELFRHMTLPVLMSH